MSDTRRAADGRSIGLVLAALAALGWGAAFFAMFQTVDTRVSADRAIAGLQNENARLAALADASEERDAVEAQIRMARAELLSTLDRRRDLEENIATLHTDLVALNVASAAPPPGPGVPEGRSDAPASQLNAALVRLDRSIAQRSSDLTALERARQDAEARLDAASDAAAALDRKMEVRTRELAAAEQRLSALLADNARLDQLNERRSADLARLSEEEAQMRRQVGAARGEIAELAQRRVDLDGEIDRLEALISESAAARSEIGAQQTRLAGLRDEIEREEARLAQTRRQLSNLQTQISRSEAQLRRLREAPATAPQARPTIEDRPDGSRVIRVRPSFN